MTGDEAVGLILREGRTGEDAPLDAVYMLFRMGDDPGQARMRNLINALRVVFRSLDGRDQIDRELAAALWLIGDMVLSNTGSVWAQSARVFRRSP